MPSHVALSFNKVRHFTPGDTTCSDVRRSECDKTVGRLNVGEDKSCKGGVSDIWKGKTKQYRLALDEKAVLGALENLSYHSASTV